MSNNLDKTKFKSDCAQYVGFVRSCLQGLDDSGVETLLDRCRSFHQELSSEEDSFRLINQGVERILLRCQEQGVHPESLELEAIELAVDWFEQLAALYVEDIPRPKSLVRELLYTLDLVERSRGVATSLSCLLSQEESSSQVSGDPFEQDPGLTVSTSVTEPQDPFAGDPGFGMEFDLLQRTLSLERAPLPEDDIFDEDDSFKS